MVIPNSGEQLLTQEQYQELVNRHCRETAHMSFTVTYHPAYQTLKSAGSTILPFLFETVRLRAEGTMLAIALVHDILGRSNGPVIPNKYFGRYDKICNIFDTWWAEKNHKRPPAPGKNYEWYSFCSVHHDFNEDCGICNRGDWRSRTEIWYDHTLYTVCPWLWRWLANRPNSKSRRRLEAHFPKLRG